MNQTEEKNTKNKMTSGVIDAVDLLGHDLMWTRRYVPTLRRNTVSKLLMSVEAVRLPRGRYLPTSLHGVITQYNIVNFTVVRTSYLTN